MRYEVITCVGHGEKPPNTFLHKVTEAIQQGAFLVGGVSVAFKGATIYWSQAVVYTDAYGLHLPQDKASRVL